MKKIKRKAHKENFDCKSTCEKCGYSIHCITLKPKNCKKFFLDQGTNFYASFEMPEKLLSH